MLLTFRDLILVIIVLILTIIRYILVFIILNKFSNRVLNEDHKMEFVCTILPAVILSLLAILSLQLLYTIEG